MSAPLILPRSCSTCRHWDEDCHCALPRREVIVRGAILEPESVVCQKHEPQQPDDVDGAAV